MSPPVSGLDNVPWPPELLATPRLVLRPTRAGDRPGYLDLLSSSQAREFLGGPLRREELERLVPGVPAEHPGVFAVERDGEFIGIVVVNRRASERPGHLTPDGSEPEVSYTLLPGAWGHGFATEAVGGVLGWLSEAAPRDPHVVLCTQSANRASVRVADKLGFVEIERFEEFGAEQWFGARPLR